jgi:putative nucleotidyltransferase with HDIG domain
MIKLTHLLGDKYYRMMSIDKSYRWSRLNESVKKDAPPVILGAISSYGEIKAVAGMDDNSKHPPEWRSYDKWRYVPDIEYLNFWETPSDKEKELVKDYLESRGYPVKYFNVYTAKPIEEELVMEASKDKEALDFLKKMVQIGPFKNKVFLAGGAVRDMELGKTPKDLDVTVIGDVNGGLNFAIWLAKQMGNYKGPSNPLPPPPHNVEVDSRGVPSFSEDADALGAYLEVYNNYYSQFSNPVLFPKFGTAKVSLSGQHNGVSLDGMDVEAVASRKEVYTPGSRKPQVFPGTLEDDVLRRDFTTNSLLMDLTTGEVLDLTGHGKEDIKLGILRTTSNPEVIFREDPLRMMRAVRFMVQKGWKIDPTTEESIRKNAEWLKHISKERIRDELSKMLVTSNPEGAIRKLRDLNMLPFIAPELQQAIGMTQNVHHTHDVFDHTMEVLKNTNPELVQRLMALFHDIGKIATRSETPTGVHFYGHEDAGEDIVDNILRNLKYPVEIIQAVKQGVKNHMRLKQGGDNAIKLSDKSLRKFKIELGDNLENVLNLIHSDNIAHASASSMPNQIDIVRKRLKSLDVQVKKPNLPINGNDIISMGVPAGKRVGEILAVITDAWFENPNLTREDAVSIVQRMI